MPPAPYSDALVEEANRSDKVVTTAEKGSKEKKRDRSEDVDDEGQEDSAKRRKRTAEEENIPNEVAPILQQPLTLQATDQPPTMLSTSRVFNHNNLTHPQPLDPQHPARQIQNHYQMPTTTPQDFVRLRRERQQSYVDRLAAQLDDARHELQRLDEEDS